ncbi:MAG: flagellar motor switch protein FliN [Nitrospinae bacterium]|nr:flagellar motor switch protein FliN [Nitrospinota bacterium]
MTNEEETSAENEEDLWAAAADDLAQQREMLREAATGGATAPAAAAAPAAAPAPAAHAPAPVPAIPSVPRAAATGGEMDRILDLPLQISVELGRTKMLINDLLQLGQGSVIELTKLVGEPLEVLVNDRLVAKGEVVVVNEKFGIRLTEIVSTQERIKSLG